MENVEPGVYLSGLGHLTGVLAFGAIAARVFLRLRSRDAATPCNRRLLRASFVALIICAGLNALCLLHILPGWRDTPVGAALSHVNYSPAVIVLSVVIAGLVSTQPVHAARSPAWRVLAIGAHPDDLEIACGGTLALLARQGCEVRGLVLSGGECGGHAPTRMVEAQRGAHILGLARVDVMNFADTRMYEQTNDLLAAIESAIRDFQPHLILTHSAHDLHQDHQVVHQATLRAARNQSTIWCYESPSVTQDFQPTVFVDVGEYLSVKVRSVRAHADQRRKPYTQPERIMGTAVFRGGQARVRYAEGFEPVRMVFDLHAPWSFHTTMHTGHLVSTNGGLVSC